MNGLEDQIATIETSELFDDGWYRARYRDVGMLAIGAAEHYLRIGASLLRDPGPCFSTERYLRAHRDVARAGVNPLLHYLRRGRKEGRRIEPSADPVLDAQQGLPRTGLEGLEVGDIARLKGEFDAGYYLAGFSGDVDGIGDPFLHFLTRGWREGRDPSAGFSTSYYLDRSPEIRKAGINPFIHYVLHGRREKRPALPYRRWLQQLEYAPRVTAIVPNYNHARFLRQRIDSILAQTYPNLDVLLLDDCSSDESREVIAEYCERHPDRVRALLNDRNAGNVFRQWRKGVEAADGDLVWICESDDFCEPDFLAALVPHFRDRSVNIAFGRIQFADRDGNFQQGLDNYREGAEPGIWGEAVVRPAQRWFAGGFGVNNVIANVGGCVWRRQALPGQVWEEAQTYTILGDWFLYCQVAGGGQIAYEPSAVAYFRQHGTNTSVSSFVRAPYYEEHQRLMTCLRERWDVPAATIDSFTRKVANQYRHFQLEGQLGPFRKYVDKEHLKQVERRVPHILVAFLGFHPGGGEVFPINLANALRAQGWQVSMLAYDMVEVNPQMLATLDPAIPVYCASQVEEMGVEAFVRDAGISLIHSHMLSLEHFFIEKHGLAGGVPYLVSLHGSYEACAITPERTARLAKRVDHWVYTAEKNLVPFRGEQLPASSFSRIANGMPEDPRPFPKTRAELGIAEDAVVFVFVARGVAGKGWGAATAAFTQLRDANPGTPVHLLMCGTGHEADLQVERHADDPDITFLGYQDRIHGLYRLGDCAIVPTRFSGESFPLCIIQALQSSTPVVATRIGEIEHMVAPAGEAPAGLLIEYTANTRRFIGELRAAMEAMLDPSRRRAMAAAALAISERYRIEHVATAYGDLYRRMLAEVVDAGQEAA